jgi:hypothetical protein
VSGGKGPVRSVPPSAAGTLGGLGGKSARDQALDGIAAAVPDAIAVVRDALQKRAVERNQQHLHTLARYVLDVVLERLPEAAGGDKPAEVQKLSPDAAVAELKRRLNNGGSNG